VITGVTQIAHITTKQDMSRWARAHADVPGIKWSVFPGEGGTMIIVEYTEDRCALNRADVALDVADLTANSAGSTDVVRMSA
jgi:hypothetical protein